MQNIIKKLICVLCIVISVMGTAVTASAYTVPFDVTWPNDPTSPRSSKDDNVQLYYVTGNYFSHSNCSLKCYSYAIYDSSIKSLPVYINSTSRSDHEVYNSYAPSGTWCAMSSSSSVNGFQVKGNYCP